MAKYAASRSVQTPDAAVAASGVLLTLGGLSLIAGKETRLGGSAIALFLSSVSPVMHNFWAVSAHDKQNETIHFSQNIAPLGAALCLATAREPSR
jgi:uncharacterized membrane protein YphA (DoxX/SURF4 family)